jgi:Tfp pilus assembly protein PilF
MSDEPSRAEHVAWAKRRALAYLDAGDVASAVASMLNDLSKHPETETIGRVMAPIGLFEASQGETAARRFIEGFQ